METTLKGTMRAMHTATGSPFPLFSLSFQASWPISSKFFVLYSSKLVLYMIEGGIAASIFENDSTFMLPCAMHIGSGAYETEMTLM